MRLADRHPPLPPTPPGTSPDGSPAGGRRVPLRYGDLQGDVYRPLMTICSPEKG